MRDTFLCCMVLILYARDCLGTRCLDVYTGDAPCLAITGQYSIWGERESVCSRQTGCKSNGTLKLAAWFYPTVCRVSRFDSFSAYEYDRKVVGYNVVVLRTRVRANSQVCDLRRLWRVWGVAFFYIIDIFFTLVMDGAVDLSRKKSRAWENSGKTWLGRWIIDQSKKREIFF